MRRTSVEKGPQDDLVTLLATRIADDHHAYASVAPIFGGEALLDSHLPCST
ncbi:hypothetical protein [Streptomyces sp. KE1]|uniref:hypothetical protein n=1 Tax=Streptomyces sp. KE1 TaxID=1638939 RepID=UPI000B013796|nr:hypothetical protein [Streptomyces sp. KE1]